MMRRTLILTLSLILFASLFVSLAQSYSIGPNYRNVSVDTTVNVTNARPEILSVTLEDPVTLNAGSTRSVECNVSVRDYNGGNTIDTVNATLFHSTSTLESADDNNTHYTNTNCAEESVSGFYANYSCSFDVQYYAQSGSWTCTSFVNDTFGFSNNNTNTTTINELYALNITPQIDYGDLAVDDTSNNETADVTNLGNAPINVSVYGYGATPGDGLAMVCDQNSISIANQRYSALITDGFATKNPLSSTDSQIAGLTIPKQTLPSVSVTNTTYWQLQVPAAENPFGICNGTVVFQAESSV